MLVISSTVYGRLFMMPRRRTLAFRVSSFTQHRASGVPQMLLHICRMVVLPVPECGWMTLSIAPR